MGNSTSTSTEGISRKASGRTRKNGGGNVKERMMARFGHRKSASSSNRTPLDDVQPASSSDGLSDDFLAVCDDAAKTAAIERRPTQLNVKAITVVRPPEPSSRPTSAGSTSSNNEGDEFHIKRISYLSQGADSAKDALESGELTQTSQCPFENYVKIPKLFIRYYRDFFSN